MILAKRMFEECGQASVLSFGDGDDFICKWVLSNLFGKALKWFWPTRNGDISIHRKPKDFENIGDFGQKDFENIGDFSQKDFEETYFLRIFAPKLRQLCIPNRDWQTQLWDWLPPLSWQQDLPDRGKIVWLQASCLARCFLPKILQQSAPAILDLYKGFAEGWADSLPSGISHAVLVNSVCYL